MRRSRFGRIAMNTKNSWLQVLRAVASIMVLLFHARPHIETSSWLRQHAGMFDFFFCGVDIFFVLSGFVIYHSAARAGSVADFTANRLIRIFGGYWPAFLLLYLIPGWLTGKQPLMLSLVLQNLFLLSPVMTDNMMPTAWSLALELWFYAWVVLGLRFFRNAEGYYIAIMLVLLAWNVFYVKERYDTVVAGMQPLRYPLTGMGVEFLFGVFVAMVFDEKKISPRSAGLGAFLCFVTGVLAYTVGTMSPLHDRVEILRAATFGIFGLSALLVFLLLNALAVKAPRILVAIGDASFSLYLIHPFLLDVFGSIRARYIGTEALSLETEALLAAYTMATIPAIIALSYLWHVFVEKTIHEKVSGWRRRHGAAHA
ncbi:acyltransferase [Verminephrobacter eiseniae]|nr:acyltransferase [Verminephrobacter eiseniae]MCW5301255.1 acyltransferase [Verminephrobacter eiseniae]MCW8179816.1 acyltransferase [Verminephrobacter eiseniae]MCW8189137.1 acyltransferase [Verminephrobacter eiseniae]